MAKPAETVTALPQVSVIVCTRNRATNIVNAASRILASDYPNFELLIVDESDDGLTAAALAPLLQTESRLHYLPLQGHGKAKALNYGWSHARGEYVVLTDDDCEMAPDCLSSLVAAFGADGTLGIVFGDVAAGPHDPRHEHIPHARAPKPKTIRDSAELLKIPLGRGAEWLDFGMGANMAIRASVMQYMHGWDPHIGPGEKFCSGDDHNLAFRFLRAGYDVHFCPAARVVHRGVRRLRCMPQDHRRIGRGFGAIFVKNLRCGAFYHGSIRALRFHMFKLAVRSLRLRRFSDNGAFILGWLSGVWDGARHPINSRTLHFEEDDQA
jgi:glycosyltransferase involved in cell wall biosynthesis